MVSIFFLKHYTAEYNCIDMCRGGLDKAVRDIMRPLCNATCYLFYCDTQQVLTRDVPVVATKARGGQVVKI